MIPFLRPASILLIFGLSACSSTDARGPYAPQEEQNRNPTEAARLTLEAAALLESDPVEAERLFRDALTSDLYHGPAHKQPGRSLPRTGQTLRGRQ